MIDITDLQQQVEALAEEVHAAVRESEGRLEAAHTEVSQVASEIQSKREKIAEMERNPLPDLTDAIPQTASSEQPYHSAELSQITPAVARVAEQIFERRHDAPVRKEVQWFYVQDSKRVGPINQSQLLDLLEHSEISWNALVWNKKLSDWTKASETELIDFSEGPPPPPIPSRIPAPKNQSGKEQKCKTCGRVNGPDDRFCAGCGKPLRSTRK